MPNDDAFEGCAVALILTGNRRGLGLTGPIQHIEDRSVLTLGARLQLEPCGHNPTFELANNQPCAEMLFLQQMPSFVAEDPE